MKNVLESLQNSAVSRLAFLAAAGAVLALAAGSAWAAPPWASMIPFKRVDADPDKSYELEESHGPWMILAASFAGPTADQQAHDLVLELRQRFKLEAYTFQQVFDFSQPTEGLGLDQYG